MLIHRFELFLRDVVYGQPLHRTDLGNEMLSTDGILSDSGFSTVTLALAPQLAAKKALELEAGPSGPGGVNLNLGPQGPAPMVAAQLNPPGPSLGLGGPGAVYRSPPPPSAYPSSNPNPPKVPPGSPKGRDDKNRR